MLNTLYATLRSKKELTQAEKVLLKQYRSVIYYITTREGEKWLGSLTPQEYMEVITGKMGVPYRLKRREMLHAKIPRTSRMNIKELREAYLGSIEIKKET